MVIRRIQNLGNGFCVRVLFDSLHILALGKQAHIESGNILRFPQTKQADRFAVGTGDHHIVSNRFHLFGIFVFDAAMAFFPNLLDMAAKAHLEHTVGTRHDPHFTARKPNIRQFYLQAIHKLLLEKAVFVKNGKAGCRIVERRKRIHEASGKSAKSAVAKTGIRFLLIQIVKLKAHFVKYRTVAFFKAQIV